MHLHIVAFDVPFPADYGGVIDVFYKIKSLHKLGVKVHLHCFKYGRNEAKELHEICEQVHYYNRHLKKKYLLNKLPLIVVSRANEALIDQLLIDEYPILFEGLHTCYFLNDKRINNRLKMVRMHNIEEEYYLQLAKKERLGFKKIYFKQEGGKLKKFEKIVEHADSILPISFSEAKILSAKYNHVVHVGAFHANETVDILQGIGKYCLYHGNLSVNENEAAALYLIKNIFSKITIPFVIAGKNPSLKLRKAAAGFNHIQLKADVDPITMDTLIQHAQINILPAFQSTGVKLKLLNALYKGRHCIVNNTMAEGSGLEDLCVIKNTDHEIVDAITRLFKQSVSESDIIKRQELLASKYSNDANAKNIIAQISHIKH